MSPSHQPLGTTVLRQTSPVVLLRILLSARLLNACIRHPQDSATRPSPSPGLGDTTRPGRKGRRRWWGKKLMGKPAYASAQQNQTPPEPKQEQGSDVMSWQPPESHLLSAQVPRERVCTGKITTGERRW